MRKQRDEPRDDERIEVFADDGAPRRRAGGGVAGGNGGPGATLIATRTTAKKQISARSSRGVRDGNRYFAAFFSLIRAALPILSLR